jgi:cytochrome c
MDFLDKLVLPQSTHHMVLLKYLLVLTYLILIPYFSILIGSNIISLFFSKRASKLNDTTAFQFAKDIIDLITFNKSIVFGLGIVPFLSVMFCYAQLLHLSPISLSGYILISLIFFISALFFLYSYKNSFHMKDILRVASSAKSSDDKLTDDIINLSNRTNIAYKKFGTYSLMLLLTSAYLFVGALKLAADSTRWESVTSILGIIFSVNTFVYFIFFLVISLLVTSAGILFYYFRPNNDMTGLDDKVKELSQKTSLNIGLISSILMPFLLLLTTVIIPSKSLTNEIFIILIVIMFVTILIANMFYFMLKKGHTKHSTSILFLTVIFMVAVIVKDQYAFDTASQLQFNKLAKNYDVYQIKLKEEMGLTVTTVNGPDIYNGRCIACHQFDKKVVGPPYKDVLVKYEGKMDMLVKFLLNPVKVDPNYPAMPNQGLKPNEAEAVADYIMKTYEEQYKK